MEYCYKTFVSVGNAKQHFSRLLNSIPLLTDLLPHPILVQAGHTPFRSTECHVVDFIAMDEFIHHVKAAELVILHAGAGSILNAIKANKYPIIVPRKEKFNEHVNDHQVAFAKMLSAEGKAMVVEEVAELKTAIQAIRSQSFNRTLHTFESTACDTIKNLLASLTTTY